MAFTSSDTYVQSPPIALPMLMTMSISGAPARTAASASATLIAVVLLPWGKPMTAQASTSEPSSTSRAIAIEYGLMHAVATSYARASFHPATISASVIVGCSREWSIILATSRTVIVLTSLMRASPSVVMKKAPALCQRALAIVERALVRSIFHLDANRPGIPGLGQSREECRPVDIPEPRQLGDVPAKVKDAALVEPVAE